MGAVLPLEPVEPFMAEVFERDKHARKAVKIAQSILEAGSLRISELSPVMLGTSPEANSQAIPRSLNEVDPREPLFRLFDEDAPFSIGDVTEVERPYAKGTEYVG